MMVTNNWLPRPLHLIKAILGTYNQRMANLSVLRPPVIYVTMLFHYFAIPSIRLGMCGNYFEGYS